MPVQPFILTKVPDQDILKVNLHSHRVTLGARVYKYRDRDTRQIVIYMPSLELTGYGANEKKAMEILNFSVRQFFEYLIKLSSYPKIDSELRELGWKHSKYKKKEYSKCFVDGEGKLQNFNAVADEVEQLAIQF